MKRKGPQRVGDVLETVLDRSGLKEPLLRAGVAEEWPKRVGEAIAKVTRARGVRNDTLIVEVRSSAWLMELNLRKEEILERLNEGRAEGRIEKLLFVLGEVEE